MAKRPKPERNRYDYQARLILMALRCVKTARLENLCGDLVVGEGALSRRISINLFTDDGSIITQEAVELLQALINES